MELTEWQKVSFILVQAAVFAATSRPLSNNGTESRIHHWDQNGMKVHFALAASDASNTTRDVETTWAMKIASVAQIKSQFSAYLKASESGPVVVTRNGKAR
ncbi:MAG TPA: hypothetical protein VGH74_22170, partial [Planctomycetaceae bacterium]